jgi:hypothetical protein
MLTIGNVAAGTPQKTRLAGLRPMSFYGRIEDHLETVSRLTPNLGLPAPPELVIPSEAKGGLPGPVSSPGSRGTSIKQARTIEHARLSVRRDPCRVPGRNLPT